MLKNKLYSSIAAALAASALLSGCASKSPEPMAAAPEAVTAPVEVPTDKPGKGEAELVVVTATVKAIDKKNRVVTLKYPDGKEAKIKCGPEVRNFPQIRVGDEVKAEFLESVELFIADSPEVPVAERSSEVARAPLGTKPGMAIVDAVEVKATVQSVNYDTREVVLLGPEEKTVKVKAGPEVKRLNEVKQGDTVVARLTKAVSITVSTPAKK